ESSTGTRHDAPAAFYPAGPSGITPSTGAILNRSSLICSVLPPRLANPVQPVSEGLARVNELPKPGLRMPRLPTRSRAHITPCESRSRRIATAEHAVERAQEHVRRSVPHVVRDIASFDKVREPAQVAGTGW